MFLFVLLTFFPAESIKLKQDWSVRFCSDCKLTPSITHNIPPVLFDSLVIQAGFGGIKAFYQKQGKEAWSYKVQGGVSSPVAQKNTSLYFGGKDGFIHALEAQDGKLKWKFFTGSENISQPVLDQDKLYVFSASQKVYALSQKTGKLIWMHAGSSLSRSFFTKGEYRPALGPFLYVGFYDGSLRALDKKTGRVKWERKGSVPLIHPLLQRGRCLLVPELAKRLLCLNPYTSQVIWKSKGGGSEILPKGSVLFQSDTQGSLYALSQKTGRIKWTFQKNKDWPVRPSIYKQHLFYGLHQTPSIYVISSQTGKWVSSYTFGKGLAAPVTIDHKNKKVYFFSVDSYLHKARIEQL